MSKNSLAERIDSFLEAASSGRPVYITDVSDVLDGHPDAVPVRLTLRAADQPEARELTLFLPRPDAASAEQSAFMRRYLEARVYNILSTFGGRSLTFYRPVAEKGITALLQSLDDSFGIGVAKRRRQGYGRCLNVAERMTDALDEATTQTASFRFFIEDIDRAPPSAAASAPFNGPPLSSRLKEVPGRIAGAAAIGMDIGGTDIKLIVCVHERIVGYKEYDWFPARFVESCQLVDPIALLARWGRARAAVERIPAAERRETLASLLDSVAGAGARDEEIRAAVDKLETYLGPHLAGLDAIGMCFPDVVVRNKIVGGEVYKTRGIRGNPAIDFESDFAQITNLDRTLSAFCRPGGRFRNVNDGPMAAFTAALEGAVSGQRNADDGIIAFTLGTELGTGWLDPAGHLPEIPLEVYNYIIDLGSLPEREFGADDPRSINNFNTGLAGTVQKYVCQSGVFRLALKHFSRSRPDLYDEIFRDGYCTLKDGTISIATEPRDMRKPLLELLMRLAAGGRDETIRDVFREIGEYLAVTCRETKQILGVRVMRPVLFGRVVKDPACMALIREGASRVSPDLLIEVADDDLAATGLMRQLRDDGRYTVAQFAQAVGAVYFSVL
ncbi:MAG: hypothetical protein ABSG17_16780 [Spirochaetia bacterium]|jgi:hypothetical protein